MKDFCILVTVLTAVLLSVSLLLDPMMGIFLTSIVTCIALDMLEKEKKHKDLEKRA